MSSFGPEINTPRGSVVITKQGKAQLVWNTQFNQWQPRFSNAQMFIDSEVLRLSEPFTPLRTSMLIKSGTLGTQIGSGEVKWIAPYARWQYYRPRAAGSETGPKRGPAWFHRMREAHGARILAGAKRIAGGGGR